jgi:cytochrome o ubiquinol oxidase subunit 2
LFLYPEQGIASVNYLQLPINRPVDFQITADAPMNSFWIPQLGGQVYAMAGMTTQLHLEASQPGDYRGVSANISGRGFADMHFIARADSESAFNAWVNQVRQSPNKLSFDDYEQLAKPSSNQAPAYYANFQTDLFATILSKFMSHSHMSDVATQPVLKGGSL